MPENQLRLLLVLLDQVVLNRVKVKKTNVFLFKDWKKGDRLMIDKKADVIDDLKGILLDLQSVFADQDKLLDVFVAVELLTSESLAQQRLFCAQQTLLLLLLLQQKLLLLLRINCQIDVIILLRGTLNFRVDLPFISLVLLQIF